MYQCRVERDSVSPLGVRLTSFVITFPRIVLAETVTHRVSSDTWGEYEVSWCDRTTTRDVSKNSASSRAIPIQKMIDRVKESPYVPDQWTAANKGMQGIPATPEQSELFTRSWLHARDAAVGCAGLLLHDGAAKEYANRLLEPWMWVTQIVTSSRWDNFFALRCHKAAHPAFRKIARMMFLARRESVPTPLGYGEWHLPFVPIEDQATFSYYFGDRVGVTPLPDLIKFSAARCAWISYENHDKDGSPDAMRATFDRLVGEVPVHASPAEHQATPMHPRLLANYPSLQSNLAGWLQARKLVRSEEVLVYDPGEEEIASWDDVR